MKHTAVQRCLLIARDGMYWAPEEARDTTAPAWVKDPALAKRIFPFGGIDDPLHDPTHYCEDSGRMRCWLKGAHIVRAEVTTVTEVKLLP